MYALENIASDNNVASLIVLSTEDSRLLQLQGKLKVVEDEEVYACDRCKEDHPRSHMKFDYFTSPIGSMSRGHERRLCLKCHSVTPARKR
jgi:hypothetical protein